MFLAISLGILACWLTIIWGDVIIRLLIHFRMGKNIRTRGAAAVVGRHLAKQGTPTFGGIMVIATVVFVTGLINLVNVIKGAPQGRSILVPIVALVLYGLLGAVDDWEGVRGLRSKGEGISARMKFLGQVVLATFFAIFLHYGLDLSSVAIPSIPFRIDLGIWYVPIAIFIIVGTSNAVNITDGLDGLAGNIAAVAFAAYGIISLIQGQIFLAVFDFIMVGGLFGFLWFNAHPARVFMGDTGSLSIGAVLAIVALMTGQWLLLPVIAFIFVVEVVTDVIQIGYFWYSERRFGERRRVFLMCPIHHTFEAMGWSEVQIVFRFMFISILAAMIGVALAFV
jgi:phospho-N-acetylmuramoyl-pentapeptide-transferase